MKKLKTIGLTIAITLFLSLIISTITDNLIIKAAVLCGLLLITFFILFKNMKKESLIIILPALASIILSLFVPDNIQWIIIGVIIIAALFMLTKKVPSEYKAITWMILLAVVLTWVLPISYSGESGLVTEGRTPVGLFGLLSYPNISVSYFGSTALFVLIIGAFYGVLYNIGAYRALLDTIVKKSKGHENIILAVIMVLIAVFTSAFGAAQGIWVIIPFVISLVLLMGYDRITAALVSVGPIAVGLIGNTFSSTYVLDASYNATQNGMGIVNAILNTKATDLLLPKTLLLIIGLAILIVCVVMRNSKNKATKKEEDTLVPTVKDKKQKVWPMVLTIDLMLLVILLSLISWTTVFNLNWFQKATNWVTSLEIAKVPLFANILGSVKPFENWGIDDITGLVFIATVVIGLIYKVKLGDFITNAVKGMKKALAPAVLIVLAYVVLVVVSYHPIILTIIKPLVSSKLNIFTMSLSGLISNVFNVDIYYSSSIVLSYVATVIKDTTVYPTIALIWQAMYGFAAIAAPTSLVLIAVLSYLDIPYTKWLKSSWKFLLALLAAVMLLITIMIFVI